MASVNKSSQDLDIKPAKATFEVRPFSMQFVTTLIIGTTLNSFLGDLLHFFVVTDYLTDPPYT